MTAWQAAVASCYFRVKTLFPFYRSLKLMTLHKEPWNSLMMYVVSNDKLALIDVRTLKQGQAAKMCLVPQHRSCWFALRLLIYAPLNNEKNFPLLIVRSLIKCRMPGTCYELNRLATPASIIARFSHLVWNMIRISPCPPRGSIDVYSEYLGGHIVQGVQFDNLRWFRQFWTHLCPNTLCNLSVVKDC